MNFFKKNKFLFVLSILTVAIVWAGCTRIHLIQNDEPEESKLEASQVEPVIEHKIEKKEVDTILKEASDTYVAREERRKKIADFCQKIDKRFKKYGWGSSSCEKYPWHFVRSSVNGDPLIWMTFGNESKERKETTVIFCGVHGDEITPIKFCFDILNHMRELSSKKAVDDHSAIDFKNRLVVVAPIVNPDSFFKKWPSRTNANGVDVNRNFPTADFTSDALSVWKNRYKKDKRRYPGKTAMSEPETLFQVNLLKRYGPNKIISVHAPLTMLDYDGPANRHQGGVVGSSANQLLIQMSEQAKGYKIKNYPFFPGSLGNYAGNERKIPTYTLELPSSDNRKSKKYWRLFKDSIHSAIMHKMDSEVDMTSEKRSSTKRAKSN